MTRELRTLEAEFNRAVLHHAKEAGSSRLATEMSSGRYNDPLGLVRAWLDRGAESPEAVGFADLCWRAKWKLTYEAFVLDPKWRPLFTEAQLETARLRLLKYVSKEALDAL